MSTSAETVASIVVEEPGAAPLFERLGIDYCCGGQVSLEEACADRGLDAATVRALLEAEREDGVSAPPTAHDVSDASITELCDHIVAAHHDKAREQMPRISELLDKVVRAHGEGDPGVHELARTFADERSEVERHMRLEELMLFPACRALDRAGEGKPVDRTLLERLRDEHAATAQALRRMRELSGDYRPEAAHCGTHQALLHALHAFELDLHQHVHEENNVLFERVRERLDSGA